MHRASRRHSRRFALNWTYLNAITQGVSAIDLGALALRNLVDARLFAREYGYDLAQPGVADYLRRIQLEALDFVRQSFLRAEQHGLIPVELAQTEDPLQLLVWASQRSAKAEPLRLWSCALLKVMHGLIYIDNNLKLRHFETIRRQVFAGLDPLIHEEGGQSYLTDGLSWLPLRHVDRKRDKGRHSILLKLLQKPEYVAADIHDHLGLRLTLGTRIECLLALDLLRRAHLVSLTNLEISRTRNSLVDLELAKQVYRRWRVPLERSHGHPEALLARMEQELDALAPPPERGDNPHRAADFHCLQLTVRKMIHLPGPEDGGAGVSFFFSYEIQLLDARSHAQSQQGAASHEAYKQRQVETARRRVLGPQLLGRLEHSAPSS